MAKATVNTAPFVNLPTTEEFILFPEDSDGVIPLDLKNQQHLRSMSPFVLTIEPPDIGSYLKKPSAKPFTGVKKSRRSISYTQDKERAMYKPNLSTYAFRPIEGNVRRDENNERVQNAGITDADQIRSIMAQHRIMKELPPIVFAINPQSMAFSYQSIQNFADPTRYGFIFHRWGEEQLTIEISCRIGAFIAGRNIPETPDYDHQISGISGLQFVSRRDSLGYRNLMSILGAYRNSATIVDLLGRSRAYHDIGTQTIHYDGQKWTGRIKSMSYSLGEDNQNGGIEFSLSFVVFRQEQDDFKLQTQLFPMTEPTTQIV